MKSELSPSKIYFALTKRLITYQTDIYNFFFFKKTVDEHMKCGNVDASIALCKEAERKGVEILDDTCRVC